MPPIPALRWRLDAWTAPAPAGGTRTAFLAEAGGRAVRDVRVTRALEAGRSQLTFRVAPDFHAPGELAPQARVLRLTRFVPTGPDTVETRVHEYRVIRRTRPVQRTLGLTDVVAVPIEEDLLDLDLYREVGGGGLASWRYGATERTPADILGDVRTRLHALGYTWIDVGTVTPTTPVSLELLGTATPRAIIAALLEALAAKDVAAEFQFTLASDLSEYRLELVTAVAGSLAPLRAASDGVGVTLSYDEDALDQANVIIPFGADGIDLRELQCEVDAVDAGTGWIDLVAIGGAAAPLLAVDDQLNGARLFRELTGRSLAITDSQASPPRVRVATGDLTSGLAAGERVSFRVSDDESGDRIFGTGPDGLFPVEVVSTATAPNRIRTRRLLAVGGANWLGVANQLRDWTAERSRFVYEWPAGTIDLQAKTYTFPDPGALPPIFADDWFVFVQTSPSTALVSSPLRVTGFTVVGSDIVVTFVQRHPGSQTTVDGSFSGVARHYRPVGTPMRILSTAVTDNELTVDALTGAGLDPFTNTDVLEIRQRCQGVRLVELTDPAAVAATRRKVATVQVGDCTGATNLVPNADLAAWAGASTDPPDGYAIDSISGTVTRTRETGATKTRYGGKSWKLAFAAGASGEVLSPVFPVNRVPGAEQVSVAVALLFERFTGNKPLHVTLYRVGVDGVRTAIPGADGSTALVLYPVDTTVDVDATVKPAIDVWYDAVLTNLSIATVQADRLQLGVKRPADGTNPAMTVYLDALCCLQREGLPQGEDGAVRWVFGSDALRMLVAGQSALLERANALVRVDGTLLDVFGLDAAAYAPWELVPGRLVSLTIAPLGIQRTVRLVSLTEDPDAPAQTAVTLERVRPDLGRRLAEALRPPTLLRAPLAARALREVRR